MAKKFLAPDFSLDVVSFQSKEVGRFFIRPMDDNTGEWV